MAEVISGTYDFIGGVVRLVRDSNLSLSELHAIRRAAAAARDSRQTPDVFAAANPAAAPIINLLIQHGKGRDWLVVFLMVLTIVISYMQNAEYHTDDEHQATKPPPAVTTQLLTTQDLTQIEQRIEHRLAADTPAAGSIRRPPTTSARQPKRKRPKHYGQSKRRRHR
jgi:hypothetical protein